ESGPAYVWANLCVSDLAMTARSVTPPWGDNDVITLLIPHRPGHKPAELVHDACDFMPRGDGCRNVSVFPEVSIDELHVGAAHSTGPDLDEHLIGLNIRNGHVLEDESLAILVHARCFHVCVPFKVERVSASRLTRRLAKTTGRQCLVTECSDSRLGN